MALVELRVKKDDVFRDDVSILIVKIPNSKYYVYLDKWEGYGLKEENTDEYVFEFDTSIEDKYGHNHLSVFNDRDFIVLVYPEEFIAEYNKENPFSDWSKIKTREHIFTYEGCVASGIKGWLYGKNREYKDDKNCFEELTEYLKNKYTLVESGKCDKEDFLNKIDDVEVVDCHILKNSEEVIEIYHPIKDKVYLWNDKIGYAIFSIKSNTEKAQKEALFHIDNFLSDYLTFVVTQYLYKDEESIAL